MSVYDLKPSAATHLRASDALTGVAAGSVWPFLVFAAKRATAGVASGICSWSSSTGNVDAIVCVFTSGNKFQATYRANNAQITLTGFDINAPAAGGWHKYGLLFGPLDGTGAQVWECYIDGVLADSGTFVAPTHTASLDTLWLGATVSGTAAAAGDRQAQYGVGGAASLVAARADVIAAHSAAPDTVAAVNNAWDLLDDAVATKGGVNFTATGTPLYDAADNPSYGGGGGSSSNLIMCCVM
jgi:hypothetical protein